MVCTMKHFVLRADPGNNSLGHMGRCANYRFVHHTLIERKFAETLSRGNYSIEIWFEETNHLLALHEMSWRPRPQRDPKRARRGPQGTK